MRVPHDDEFALFFFARGGGTIPVSFHPRIDCSTQCRAPHDQDLPEGSVVMDKNHHHHHHFFRFSELMATAARAA